MASVYAIARWCSQKGCVVDHRQKDGDIQLERVAHIEDADVRTLSWYRGVPPGTPCPAGAVVTQQRLLDAPSEPALVVCTPDPRGVMAGLVEHFFAHLVGDAGRHLDEVLHERDFGAVGGGRRIHRTAVLGSLGQHYAWNGDEDAGWETLPHIGGVRIAQEVHIGAGATIMRGTFGDTVLGFSVKIGPQVNIGHDVRIARRSLIAAGARLAGWVRVEEDVRIWQGALIKNGVRIGKGAEVGMGAVVIRDVAPGDVVVGNPARSIR